MRAALFLTNVCRINAQVTREKDAVSWRRKVHFLLLTCLAQTRVTERCEIYKLCLVKVTRALPSRRHMSSFFAVSVSLYIVASQPQEFLSPRRPADSLLQSKVSSRRSPREVEFHIRRFLANDLYSVIINTVQVLVYCYILNNIFLVVLCLSDSHNTTVTREGRRVHGRLAEVDCLPQRLSQLVATRHNSNTFIAKQQYRKSNALGERGRAFMEFAATTIEFSFPCSVIRP